MWHIYFLLLRQVGTYNIIILMLLHAVCTIKGI